MLKLRSFAAVLLGSAALVSCGGGDSSPPTSGGGSPPPSPSPSPSPTPSPTPPPTSYTKFAEISGAVELDTACFSASPNVANIMPDLFGPQGFGADDVLNYDGSDYSVSIATQNGLSQNWTGDQRANRTTGWGPDEDQYSWVKRRTSDTNFENLTMFVPMFSSAGDNLSDYSRLIEANIVGAGTTSSLTYCVAGAPTFASDLPTGSKTYSETDTRWGVPWENDGTGAAKRGSFSPTSTFEMTADFDAATVTFDILLESNAFALSKNYGPYTGTGSIDDNGAISADLATPDGVLRLRGSFFGPGAGEFAIAYGLEEDTNNDGTNELVMIGAVGGRD